MKSKYELGVEHFSTKRAIEEKVRGILNSGVVSDRDCVFLMDLFQNHDEWRDKVGVGVAEIRVGDAESVNPGGWGPSSCFWLVRVDGSRVQISYRHCLGNLGRRGWGNILSTYRTAARSAIDQQVKEFKRSSFGEGGVVVCPDTKQKVDWSDSEVDHVYPMTFDQLLFDFTRKMEVKSLRDIEIVNYKFKDSGLERHWQEYHARNADLEVVSKVTNRSRRSVTVDWSSLCF